MALLTAEQAAKRFNRTERTVRRWIRDGMLTATHPTHGRKDKYLIEESEVERLASELAKEQPEQQKQPATSEDTSSLTAHMAELEQRLAALEHMLSVGTPAQPSDRILRPEQATYTTEPPTDIPAGSIPHYIFARNHNVPARTFLEQLQKGKVPNISRPKLNKPRETEHWLTPEQQQAAFAFWTRNGTKFTRCSACPHDQDQQSLQSDQVETLPTGYVPLRAFSDLHCVARNAVEPMRKAGFIAVERGKWKNEDGQEVTEALSLRGQRDLWVQFHSQDSFRPCDACPHDAARK